MGSYGRIELQGIDTVADLKVAVEERHGIPAGNQRLMYNGKGLEDSQSLSYYNITNECTVTVVIRYRAGNMN